MHFTLSIPALFRPLTFLAVGVMLSGCTKEVPPPPPKLAQPPAARRLDITVVEEGFRPDSFTVTTGEPLALVVTRTTDATCATELLIDGTAINTPLPLGKPVTIEWTPTKAGKVVFGCAMDKMVAGVLLVEDARKKAAD